MDNIFADSHPELVKLLEPIATNSKLANKQVLALIGEALAIISEFQDGESTLLDAKRELDECVQKIDKLVT